MSITTSSAAPDVPKLVSSVRLTDPKAGALQVIADGGVDVSMRVSNSDFDWAWSRLGKIMEDDPSSSRKMWDEEGRTDEELRLLVGLFWAVSQALPMNVRNFIDWLDTIDASNALDDFAAYRVRQMDAQTLIDRVLYDRDLDTLGLERIEEPVRRRRRVA